jgi:hypothetical protein
MDWKIRRSEIRYAVARDASSDSLIKLPDQHVLFRSDNNDALGVVSKRYQVVQPGEVLEFFRDIAKAGGLELSAAGTIYGGKRFWATAKIGETSVPFKPLPPEMFAVGKTLLEQSMLNFIQATATYALDPAKLFTGPRPARGLFASVLDNRRAWTLKADVPSQARLWLNGKEVKHGQFVQLQPGYYAYLLEIRVAADTTAPIGTALHEFPTYLDWATTQYNPVIEPVQRLDRIRQNQAMLRRIAASGPAGAYAQEALDTLKAATPPGKE